VRRNDLFPRSIPAPSRGLVFVIYYAFLLSVGSDMKRREFLGTLGAVAALPLATHAQQPTNIPRLCFLTFDPGCVAVDAI
jgi:hypothetical protein